MTSPLSRRLFLSGSAALLAAPAFIHRARAADVPLFELGVASGHPQPHAVVLWTRLMGEQLPRQVPVSWELAQDEAFTRVVARGSEIAERGWAHSVHAEPRGLSPGRWYYYRFQALGQRSPVGRTRTAPAPAAEAPLAFAIASCQHYEVGHYAAWRHLAGEPLDLVLFLGDYIYEGAPRRQALRQHEGEGPAVTLEQYRARYATYKRDPLLQAAHAACPWLTVWDDHEVQNDYAGLRGQELERNFPLRRMAAYQAYWEHLPFPKAARPRRTAMRIYGRTDWGRLARLHLLDDRQYRDPQPCPPPRRGGSNTVLARDCPELADPRRSLLGARQERWLAEGWDLHRPWNLVAQQTLMARCSWRDPAAPDSPAGEYWTDGWDGYPAARRRLLQGVAERGLSGVVVLGGDVHSHCVSDLKLDFDDTEAPALATEFCSTSITSTSLPQSQLDAMRPWNPHLHYARSDQRGYMRFDLDAKRLSARLLAVEEVKDPDSPVATVARFEVDPRHPGARRDGA
ncbi:alkaline phosphatase D family protein [Eleftheria terrae]|uniref:alkaline phosphatase D family protein n=1 Tax=Eleftheria terrae TaxID=1597781 RepID=UPI00263ADC61|nr:alkaline phosphatase D family protein [Eleftheria terrae]WKB51532.1 alkaline phosphatase D family protein [Eleftheria terrae]